MVRVMKNDLINHYKTQTEKAQKYLVRYIDELKLHFGIEDSHVIKIMETELKNLKNKYCSKKWFKFWR